MMVKCPVCKERHPLNNNYDNKEFICKNSANRQTQKIFQDMEPIDLLTRPMFLLNRSSTRVDEGRAATVKVKGPSYNTFGLPIRQKRKTNW